MRKKWNVLVVGCILAVMMSGLAGCGKKEKTNAEEVVESIKALNELAEEQENIKDAYLTDEEDSLAAEQTAPDEKAKSDTEVDTVEKTEKPEAGAEHSEGKQSAEETTSADAVDPELKAFLDEYEAFMDEYISFMKKYKDAGNSTQMLSDYLEIMQKYTEFATAVEDYDSEEMSAADAAYYLEVTTRVSKKLLEAVY